jgi:hypothetical protein
VSVLRHEFNYPLIILAQVAPHKKAHKHPLVNVFEK